MKKSILVITVLVFSGLSVFASNPVAVARWSKNSRDLKNCNWKNGGALPSEDGNGSFSFVGTDPELGIAQKIQSVAVSNIFSGDYFLFTLKVGKLPKGSQIDFATSMGVLSAGAPEKWICEVFDGKKWCSDGPDCQFTLKHYEKTNPTTYLHSFILKKACKKEVKVRLRCLESSSDPKTEVLFLYYPWVTAYLAAFTEPAKDVTKAVFLGNSFTFFGGSFVAFHEIAMSQGHRVDMNINLKGGQQFGQHLRLERSMDAVNAGGYQIAVLQNLSRSASLYDKDPVENAAFLDDAVTLADKVRASSPGCRVILERTWAFAGKDGSWLGYGNAEDFDAALARGSKLIGEAMGAEVSPIGEAFILARERDLPVYFKDNFHQGFLGAYLKACVNYLFIFHEPFSGEVSDFGLPADQAAECRRIATSVVLGN